MTQVGTQCGWWREAGGTWSLSEALSCTPLTPSLPTWLHRRHRGHAQRHQWGRDGPTLAGVGGAPSPQPHLSPHPRPHPPKTARTPRPTCGLYPLQPLEPPTPGPWPFWDSSPCSAPPLLPARLQHGRREPPPCSTPGLPGSERGCQGCAGGGGVEVAILGAEGRAVVRV